MSTPKPTQTPISIRLKPELEEKLKEAAEMLGLDKSDMMRLALAVGLERLARIDFKVERAIEDAAERAQGPVVYAVPKPNRHSLNEKPDSPGRSS